MLPYLRSRIMRSLSNRRFLPPVSYVGKQRVKATKSRASFSVSPLFIDRSRTISSALVRRPLGSTEFLPAVGVASIEDRDDKFSLRRFVVTIGHLENRLDNDLSAVCSPPAWTRSQNRIFYPDAIERSKRRLLVLWTIGIISRTRYG